MKANILSLIKNQNKGVAVLIDPDKFKEKDPLIAFIKKINGTAPDFIFIGGSTVSRNDFNQCVELVKSISKIPIVIFPGAAHQVHKDADAILFLSLLSGRNPDFLIGHHIQAVDELMEMEIEVLPCAYLLIEGGKTSAVQYVTQTAPIPVDQINIIRKTALAGKFQGKKIIYLDAGSGAKNCISAEIIKSVSSIGLPLIIGGGIRSIEGINNAHKAGANIVVIGNKIEDDINFLKELEQFNKMKALEILGSN